MYESPRIRRLRSDLAAMERLRDESSVIRFRASGKPIQHYIIEFRGKSLARLGGRVKLADHHEVEIKLGASYPRTMPELRWLTPIYHPNISEIGMVCLGGYGTHWVPSLNLDELCGMLWDMARYHNYDVRSPYNREAALWVANQSTFAFPVDVRPLRDLRAALGRIEGPHPSEGHHVPDGTSNAQPSPGLRPPSPTGRGQGEGPNSHREAALERADPGSKAGKYAQFVRKFADELNRITPAGASRSILRPEALAPDELASNHTASAPPPAPAASSSSSSDPEVSDLVFVVEGDEDERAPNNGHAATPRLRAADEDILFIE
jgi:ubiquitin-protein ligase